MPHYLPMQSDEDLLTTSEALEILGLTSRSTMSRYVQLGRITPVRRAGGGFNGGAFLFRRGDVLQLRQFIATPV